jgi:flavin reductase ActVB
MITTATVYPSSVRDAMAQWPTGIAVVTTSDQDGWCWGCIADSFAAVSIRPPLISVCIDREHRCRSVFTAADMFAVNVLRSGQEDLARRFGGPDAEDRDSGHSGHNWHNRDSRDSRDSTDSMDNFDGIEVEHGFDDVPLLCDVSVRMECRTTNVVPAGDHVMLLAEVVRVRTGPGEPLVYLRRNFRRLSRHDQLAA